ncbi:MAG: Unknown protein [uncultured Thiotrichaceae bacterium]|uniref:C4-dicarboxylate transport sensor protein DctB n=1 Tax=uncultured Thiotrichaceae bacterium TaxID=298394 RepID=A0A6S6S8X3_9GAMM|nr:MAG: Unknown protein [uncultured Thiotrichaceae bacterium]
MKPNKPLILIATLLLCLTVILVYLFAKENAIGKLQKNIKTQLLQTVNELKITLERHAYLPSVIANEQAISHFLESQDSFTEVQRQQKNINLWLERTNNLSGTSAIFLMTPEGKVIASSNGAGSDSFLGSDFSQQPYFQYARQNILGRYYAIEPSTKEPAYFFARSIHAQKKVIGVAAVQVNLNEIVFNWGLGNMDFIITDEEGIIFLSSNKAWHLHTLSPIHQSDSLDKTRYNVKSIPLLSDSATHLKRYGFQTIKLQNSNYEMLTERMELADWDVRVLANHAAMYKTIFANTLISTLLILLLTSIATLLWKIQQQRKHFEQQTRMALENKVIKRTQALKQSQEDLIQAAKMAALGQLSASITHEINNPLTAIRAYTDNANQFLKKNRLDMVESNLTEIATLTDSMAAITHQLKAFSRKSKGEMSEVNLGVALKSALSILNPKIVSSQIVTHIEIDLETSKELVFADELWLGQVLVNLISNAISATQGNVKREIWIAIADDTETTHDESRYCIEIRDNGMGINDETLPHIFEPFFTTKPSSKGLGLGLSISFNLVKDMNGSLHARNRVGGGALFTLCLPAAFKRQ